MPKIKGKDLKQAENRLIGGMPKIGIRPTIDGRLGGVRESLEDQTMDLAKAVAKLLTEEVRHSNGMPVECVIPERCIGGAAEAAKTQDLFEQEGVGVSLTVTPCWCYGSETMDMDPLRPKAVWGFNGTERPGAVYLAAVLAAHNQKGLPAFGIYGRDVQDAGDPIPDDVREKLLRFARSALTVATMRDKSYLSMGGVSMGIAGSIVDPDFFEQYLGMRVESVDLSEFVRRIEEEIYDKDEFNKALKWVKENCKEGEDRNDPSEQHSRERKDQEWETVVKMTQIARDLMIGNEKLEKSGFGEEALGHNAIVSGFQGQRHWTDHFPNADFLEAILNTSFDWNGIREPFVVATENDSLNGVCMLFGHLLTNKAQIFADVRTFWSPQAVKRVSGYELTGTASEGFIHLINSGSASLDGTARQKDADGNPTMKPFWEITDDEAKACLEPVTWYPGALGYFRGGGFSSQYVTPGGVPMTMSRLNIVKGLGPVLQVAEGWTIDLPDHVHEQLNERTDPTWPTHWFVPRTDGKGPFRDVYTVMNNWGANHCALSHGHIGADLITLASILRIPVYMHNVDEEKIFRPAAWTAFGAMDPQGADFRACANFGPLYS